MSATRPVPQPWWRSVPILAVAACYAAAWLLLPHAGFFINDSGCKLIQVEGMIRNGYTDLSVPWPGRDLDPGLEYRPLGDPFGKIIDGRLFVAYPIPFAFLSSIPYRLIGPPGLLVLPLLAGLLLLPAIAALADLLPGGAWSRALAVPAVALGTPVWFYSLTFWEHVPAVCLVTWGLVCLLRYFGGGPRRSAVVGALLCGLAIDLRDDMALLVPALVVLPLLCGRRSPRDPLLILGWTAAALAPLWVLQWAVLGTPLGIHAAAHGPLEHGFAAYLADRWTVFRDLVIDAHGQAWLSLLMAVPYVGLLAVHPRLDRGRWMRLVPALLLWGVGWGCVALAGHLTTDAPMWYLQSANGLFATSPFLIIACLRDRAGEDEEPPGAGRTGSDDAGAGRTGADGRGGRLSGARVRLALWCVVVVYLAGYVAAAPPVHVRGIHWGSRLLLPLFPLLGVLAISTAGRYIERLRSSTVGVALVLAAVAVSIAFQVDSLRLLGAREAFSARLNREVAARPETVVVATHWSVPQEIAQVFYAKSVFLARSPEEFGRLTAMLRGRGVRRILRIDAAPGTRPAVAGALVLNDGLNFMSYTLVGQDLP